MSRLVFWLRGLAFWSTCGVRLSTDSLGGARCRPVWLLAAPRSGFCGGGFVDGQISLDEYLSTGWPAVITATDTVVTMVSKAWGLVLANPLARVYVAGGLLAVGIGFLVVLRRSSRR